MNQEVTEYVNNLNQKWQVDVCNQIRQIIHKSIPDIVERLQYRKPHYLKNGKYAAVISPAKDRESFTIFNATELEPPEGMFEPDNPEKR